MNQPARRSRRDVSQPAPDNKTKDLTLLESGGAIAAETAEAFHRMFSAFAAAGKYNLVSPITAVNVLPPFTQVAFAQVQIDITPEAGEVYQDRRFCKSSGPLDEQEVALTKVAISRLAAAAHVQKISSRRTDSRKETYFVEWTTLLAVIDFDGTPRQVEICKTIDLRDGEPATMKAEWICGPHKEAGCSRCKSSDFYKTGNLVPLDGSALAEKRIHQQSNAETKAFNRGIRELLHLKQKYRVGELRKAFVVPHLIGNLPADDPDVKAAAIQKYLFGAQSLYSTKALPAATDAYIGEAIRVKDAAEIPEGARAPERKKIIEAEPEPIAAEPEPAAREAGPSGPEPPPIEGTRTAPSSGAGGAPPPARASAETSGKPEPAPSKSRPSEGAGGKGEDAPQAQAPAGSSEDPEPPESLEPGPNQCSCPCGCEALLNAGELKKCARVLKVNRCKACYPDAGFDFERHAGVGKLGLPGYPDADSAQVKRWNEKRARARA